MATSTTTGNASHVASAWKLDRIGQPTKPDWYSVMSEPASASPVSAATEPPSTSTDTIVSVILGGLALSTAVLLSLQGKMQSRWAVFMDTAGFVDWPSLGYTKLRTAGGACTIAMCAITIITLPSLDPTRRPDRVRLTVTVLLLMATLATVAFTILLCCLPMQIPRDVTLQLMGQADAVATFNRGYCHAWCRSSHAAVALLAKGECGAIETTIFDEIVGTFDVGSWCREAIEKQNYELAAAYVGVSPFLSLKEKAARGLITGDEETFDSNFKYAIMGIAACGCLLISVTAALGTRLAPTDKEKKNE